MWYLEWIAQRISWTDILDIVLVAFLFFWMFYAIRGTRAVPLVRGITALLILLVTLLRLIELTAFSWIIEQLVPALLVGIPVLFQPELRRALEQLGRGSILNVAKTDEDRIGVTIEQVVTASKRMARHKTGALIIFERKTGLQEYIETGIEVNAAVSVELLLTIFNHNTILHDGAVIIRQNRIAAAACVMPLTAAFLEDRELGLRHRAAIGITEDTDTIAVVVSEERGAISLTHNGRIIRDMDPKRLESILRTFLLPKPRRGKGIFGKLNLPRRKNKPERKTKSRERSR